MDPRNSIIQIIKHKRRGNCNSEQASQKLILRLKLNLETKFLVSFKFIKTIKKKKKTDSTLKDIRRKDGESGK